MDKYPTLPVNFLWESLRRTAIELRRLPKEETERREMLEEKTIFLKRKLLAQFPEEANQ